MGKKESDIDYEHSVRVCPFCGHHGQKLVVVPHHLINRDEGGEILEEHHELWHVECNCCGARGPEEFEARFAVNSWNINHAKPAHDDDPLFLDFPYDEGTIRKKAEKDNGSKA